jgi:hypothetical protein
VLDPGPEARRSSAFCASGWQACTRPHRKWIASLPVKRGIHCGRSESDGMSVADSAQGTPPSGAIQRPEALSLMGPRLQVSQREHLRVEGRAPRLLQCPGGVAGAPASPAGPGTWIPGQAGVREALGHDGRGWRPPPRLVVVDDRLRRSRLARASPASVAPRWAGAACEHEAQIGRPRTRPEGRRQTDPRSPRRSCQPCLPVSRLRSSSSTTVPRICAGNSGSSAPRRGTDPASSTSTVRGGSRGISEMRMSVT